MRPAHGQSAGATVLRLLELLTRALGQPVSTPEVVRGDSGRLERSRYRTHHWGCPVCRTGGPGSGDPIYRPLVLDSAGNLHCQASHCAPEAIGCAVRELLASGSWAA